MAEAQGSGDYVLDCLGEVCREVVIRVGDVSDPRVVDTAPDVAEGQVVLGPG